jgi:pyruvate-formate lyase-activating enzyme
MEYDLDMPEHVTPKDVDQERFDRASMLNMMTTVAEFVLLRTELDTTTYERRMRAPLPGTKKATQYCAAITCVDVKIRSDRDFRAVCGVDREEVIQFMPLLEVLIEPVAS